MSDSLIHHIEDLVNRGGIEVIGLNYPTNFPKFSQTWSGYFISKSEDNQVFTKANKEFEMMCYTLLQDIFNSMGINSSGILKPSHYLKDNHPNLYKLQDHIDECVVLGNPSWILTIEYLMEESSVGKCCGLVNGFSSIEINVNECATSFDQVCLLLWEQIRDYRCADYG